MHLKTILDCLGKDTPASTIDETTVKTFWQYLVDKVKSGAIGNTTAADKFALFREWVRSIYAVPLPHNLHDRSLAIAKPTKTVTTWTPAEVQALLAKASERFQLFVLLMLNCGMYSGHIRTSSPPRSIGSVGGLSASVPKRRTLDSTPTVNYKLWGRTFELLRKYGKRTGEWVFTNRKGLPITQHQLQAKRQDEKSGRNIRLLPLPMPQRAQP